MGLVRGLLKCRMGLWFRGSGLVGYTYQKTRVARVLSALAPVLAGFLRLLSLTFLHAVDVNKIEETGASWKEAGCPRPQDETTKWLTAGSACCCHSRAHPRQSPFHVSGVYTRYTAAA